jgi:long-chain acyl-CoA synthetase
MTPSALAAHSPAPSPAAVARGTTLVAHFRRQVSERADRPAMYLRVGERWAPITWRQYGDAAKRISAFLLDEGVEIGGHVAIWASNRPEWHIADAAILSVRARPVPVYLTFSADQGAYVLGHAEATVVFVDNASVLAKVLAVRRELPALRRIVVMEDGEPISNDGVVLSWTEALGRGQAATATHRAEVERRMASVLPDDVATLIYTSGTTGPPKAVKLTHRNVLAAAASVASLVPASAEDRVISYLPLAHIAERGNSEFRQYIFGSPVYFAVGMERLSEHLRDIRPTLFFAVPRIWEKMAAGVHAQLDRQKGPRRWLASWALAVGDDIAQRAAGGQSISRVLARRHRAADRLVLLKLRQALGLDQANVVASGAAPIAPEVLRFFASMGLVVLEVYGQTENTGVATMNRPGHARIGTVGTPVPGVDVRTAADGEIQVRGDVVFAGYHNDDAATAETMDGEWLCTGDVGEFDADGYLRITDRKKDLIITAGGKNIAPSNIESALKHHRLISNAVVIGDRRPFVSALITLDPGEAAAYAEERGVSEPAAAVNAQSAVVREEIQHHVDEVNRRLSNVEAVKRWTLLDNDFTVGDELTPTLKVKRKVVLEKYAAEIEANYSLTK